MFRERLKINFVQSQGFSNIMYKDKCSRSEVEKLRPADLIRPLPYVIDM